MLGAAFFMASCGGQQPAEATHDHEHEEHADHDHEGDGHDHGDEVAESTTYAVDAEASNIKWEGGTSGVQVYSHFGNINLQEGSLTLEGDALSGGSFIVDMTSIDPTDEGYSDEHPKEDLIGHLSTEDFFAIEANPTASFEITSVADGVATGNLTIRGNTHEETIAIESMDVTDSGVSAKGTLVFDRQKYDVAWAHYLQDVLLKDDITLEIDLVASK